mmetsp:Transcript_1287/g.2325  ORF Transcript_1287/g.2325 Transcript_1287/m.2325 type:complete len:95 (+) Transcript_1287:135-419(+)
MHLDHECSSRYMQSNAQPYPPKNHKKEQRKISTMKILQLLPASVFVLSCCNEARNMLRRMTASPLQPQIKAVYDALLSNTMQILHNKTYINSPT